VLSTPVLGLWILSGEETKGDGRRISGERRRRHAGIHKIGRAENIWHDPALTRSGTVFHPPAPTGILFTSAYLHAPPLYCCQNTNTGELRFRALLSENGVDRLELARSLP
jgi:hypothetical protein